MKKSIVRKSNVVLFVRVSLILAAAIGLFFAFDTAVQKAQEKKARQQKQSAREDFFPPPPSLDSERESSSLLPAW